MSSFTVKSVWNEPREWQSSRGGSFLSYKVDLEKEDGTILKGVEWSRKVESKAPQVEDRIAGHIEEGQYGMKFKMDFEATKALGGGRRPELKTGGNWQPESERDPERAARILRQHSQEMALRFHAMTGQEPTLEGIKFLADAFDQDVIDASKAATPVVQGAQTGGVADPSPTIEETYPAEDKGLAEHQLEDSLFRAGVTDVVERRWLERKFNSLPADRAGVALTMLTMGDENEVGKALAQLRKEAGEVTDGFRKSVEADTDEIPF